MPSRNPHFAKFHSGYLFPEVTKRKNVFLQEQPNAHLIHLGIGDTTSPLPEVIVQAFKELADSLGTPQGYTGYGPEQGSFLLRQAIADHIYQGMVSPDEIFISDGSKCDIGRLQILFGEHSRIAVQDPTYPVYVDTGVGLGMSDSYTSTSQHYAGITYMKCTPDNHFFPDLRHLPDIDLLFFCSPNNPTGAVASYEQLQELVAVAKKKNAFLIFDAAYAAFIQDPLLPKSIYAIPGAKEVAIELSSFSKTVGFTGVRLGWSVVPKQLLFSGGEPVHQDWNRLHSTYFNGASNLAQAGGLASLSTEGLKAIQGLCKEYLENAFLLKTCLQKIGYRVFGGEHIPYLFVDVRPKTSWGAFEEFLRRYHLVTTPGSGFGPAGEGFLRFSAFAKRSGILEAIERLHP